MQDVNTQSIKHVDKRLRVTLQCLKLKLIIRFFESLSNLTETGLSLCQRGVIVQRFQGFPVKVEV